MAKKSKGKGVSSSAIRKRSTSMSFFIHWLIIEAKTVSRGRNALPPPNPTTPVPEPNTNATAVDATSPVFPSDFEQAVEVYKPVYDGFMMNMLSNGVVNGGKHRCNHCVVNRKNLFGLKTAIFSKKVPEHILAEWRTSHNHHNLIQHRC